MPKPRGKRHTTLTETATRVVREIERLPGIKMIGPGEIKKAGRRQGGTRHLTVVYTTAGLELIITGQSVQKVSIHTDTPQEIYKKLRTAKALKKFTFLERERKPGI